MSYSTAGVAWIRATKVTKCSPSSHSGARQYRLSKKPADSSIKAATLPKESSETRPSSPISRGSTWARLRHQTAAARAGTATRNNSDREITRRPLTRPWACGAGWARSALGVPLPSLGLHSHVGGLPDDTRGRPSEQINDRLHVPGEPHAS